MIFGKLSDFIDMNNDNSIIGYHDHFIAIKNIDNLQYLLIDNQYKCYYMCKVFCDNSSISIEN